MSALDFHVEVLRETEKLCRADGFFEQANAVRLMADAFESGAHCHDLCFFDRGVFDVYGPPDEGEIPYLVDESPRLHPELDKRVLRCDRALRSQLTEKRAAGLVGRRV